MEQKKKKVREKLKGLWQNKSFQILFWTAAIIGLIAAIIRFAVGSVTVPYAGTEISLSSIWTGLGLAYLVLSWRFWDPVGPDEIAVRVILGRPIDTVTSGPPFAPLGVTEILKYPTATVQREFPAEPELIFRPKRDESEMIPTGSNLVPPLRITFADTPLTAEEAKNIFGEGDDGHFKVQRRDGGWEEFKPGTENLKDGLSTARVTAEVSHISRYRIFNAVSFTKTVPDTVEGGRIAEVFRQIEDEQVIALNTILVQMTVAQAMQNVAWINAVLFRKVCRRIKADAEGHSKAWGIDIEGSAIKPIQFHRDLNASIASVPQAINARRKAIIDAEGQKASIILKGEGDAQAARDLERETLEGRADGLQEIAKVASTVKGRAAIGSEVARKVAEGGNTIVVGTGGMEQVIGLAAAAAATTKKQKGSDG